ncbi:MAG: hypothetical protein R2747_06010 [Pyrinomonadaceae bacterium]
MSTYRLESRKWGLRTAGGVALGKGFGPGFLSVQGGAKIINFEAKGYDSARGKTTVLNLRMTVTGFEVSIEKGIDLLEEFSGLSVARIVNESQVTRPLINTKNPTELRSYDFTGPCSMVSFDVGKAHLGKELGKHAGATYLFLGQNTTIVDRSPDWLQKVVDNSTSGTLGGNVYNFNKNNGPFSNARAATRIEVNDQSPGAKVTAASIALYSGQIVASRAHSY